MAPQISAETSKGGSSKGVAAIARLELDDQPEPTLILPAIDHGPLFAEAKALEALGRHRFATARDVDVRPSTHGRWVDLGNGRSRWQLDVKSEGANSLNLAFGEYRMPPGGSLYVGGEDEQSRFTFTDRDNDEHGELWTPIIPGESLSIRVDIDNALAPQMKLALAKINHGFRPLRSGGSLDKNGKIGTGSSGSCNIDVVCSAADDPQFGPLIDRFRDQIQAVGAYTLQGIDTCTGTLINNAAGDARPYFLTADHCGVSTNNARSMVVYWNFQNTFCRRPNSSSSGSDGNGPINQFNSGAIFRATSRTTDFTLVELDDPANAAANVFFAGWDRSGNNPAMSVAIHHPAVTEKRISFELDRTRTTSYLGTTQGDGTHVRVADWDFGTTEPGSSGSAIFDDNGRIFGQLHGGGAACGNNLADWYGRLSVSWEGLGSSSTRLRDWLDPNNSGIIALDGSSGTQELTINSATVTEGASGTTVNALLTVTLTPATQGTVTVRVTAGAGETNPATPGTDFALLDTTLTFAPGQTQRTVNLTVNGDALPEEHEEVSVMLSNATNATANPTPGTVVILNDDYAPPVISSPLMAETSAQAYLLYQIAAQGTPTSFSIENAPAGMTVDPLTGHLNWLAPAPGDYSVDIVAHNPAGSGSATLQISVGENQLADALDLPEDTTLTISDDPWFAQSVTTWDGEDAAQSAPIGNSEGTSFTLDVTGPDAIRFLWKVSSQEGSDFLSVSVDNVEMDAISGEIDWHGGVLAIPEGDHQITWSYDKDGSGMAGDDAAWVDVISFSSDTGEPIIVSPREAVITLGDPFTYEVVSIDPTATIGAFSLPDGMTFDNDHTISGTPTTAGIYNIIFTADNGLTPPVVYRLVLSVFPDVGPAVEELSQLWVAEGDAFWFPQTHDFIEDGDAAQGGDVGDDGETTVSIDATGPDELSFWWRVSSQQGSDFLRFMLDGQVVQEISGEVGWHRVVYSVPSGAHTLSWSFVKDGAGSAGRDTGWLDNVSLASTSPLPHITSPTSAVAFDGEEFFYQITAVNSPQTFGADSLPAGLQVDPETGVISGELTAPGTQNFTVWAENILGRSELEITVTRAALDTAIPPAIEQPMAAVSNLSAVPWTVSSTRSFAGSTSAGSGNIGNNESTKMTAYVAGPGSASFHWNVSSEEDSDFLVFLLDGEEIDRISGEVGWTEVNVDLPAGLHELQWCYEKDAATSQGADGGWVDNLQLSGYAAFANDAGLRFSRAVPTVDFDEDSFAGILEFVFGTSPDDAAEFPVISVASTDTEVVISFTGTDDLDGVSLTLQKSSDLKESWFDLGVQPQVTPAGTGRATYRFTVPRDGGDDSCFYRIQASAGT